MPCFFTSCHMQKKKAAACEKQSHAWISLHWPRYTRLSPARYNSHSLPPSPPLDHKTKPPLWAPLSSIHLPSQGLLSISESRSRTDQTRPPFPTVLGLPGSRKVNQVLSQVLPPRKIHTHTHTHTHTRIRIRGQHDNERPDVVLSAATQDHEFTNQARTRTPPFETPLPCFSSPQVPPASELPMLSFPCFP